MPAPTTPRTPAECLATIVLWLSLAVDGHSTWGKLARPLALLILNRIRLVNQCFRRIAERVRDGRYRPRGITAPRRGAAKPRPPNKLPSKFGWLPKLLPDANGYRAQLECLFRDPAMVALLEAAPKSLGRPLRSLCHMLGLPPPDILAAPRRPAKPRPPRPQPPPEPPEPPPPPRPEPPEWLRGLRRSLPQFAHPLGPVKPKRA